jgi:hypothetical protein
VKLYGEEKRVKLIKRKKERIGGQFEEIPKQVRDDPGMTR